LPIKQGYGGIQALAAITGLHRNTNCPWLRETQADALDDDGRIRQTGGGRQTVEKKNRGFLPI